MLSIDLAVLQCLYRTILKTIMVDYPYMNWYRLLEA